MRAQALSRFFDSYLPDKASTYGFSHLSFLTSLPYRDSTNPALRSAIEAVSVAQIGAEYNDQNLIRNASVLYQEALSQLHAKLASTVADADTLAASMLLQICEFSPGASNDGTGYQVHASGQVSMLHSLGPETVARDPFLFQLFLSVRNSEFTIGVLKRQKIVFGGREWLNITANVSLIDPWSSLTDIFAQMPELQENLDKCAISRDAFWIESTAALLFSLDSALVQHRYYFASQLAPHGPWLTSYESLRYVRDIPPPPNLRLVYRFSNFRAALLYTLFWGLQWDLLRARNKLQDFIKDAPHLSLGSSSYGGTTLDCGFEMAKSSSFYCQTRFGCAGRIGSLVGLKYASAAFLEEGRLDEARWCSTLSEHIKENSLCQPKIWSIPV